VNGAGAGCAGAPAKLRVTRYRTDFQRPEEKATIFSAVAY
jgi:hypothetical protein